MGLRTCSIAQAFRGPDEFLNERGTVGPLNVPAARCHHTRRVAVNRSSFWRRQGGYFGIQWLFRRRQSFGWNASALRAPGEGFDGPPAAQDNAADAWSASTLDDVFGDWNQRLLPSTYATLSGREATWREGERREPRPSASPSTVTR
jgi:hypothetical protein